MEPSHPINVPLPLARRESSGRDRASSFAVYASFVASEFSNLAHTAPHSPLVSRGTELKSEIQQQLDLIRRNDGKRRSARLPDDYAAVFDLDRLNLRLMCAEQLKLRAFALVERYRLMFSGEELARITQVVRGVDPSNGVSEQTMRAQADEVLASMHWYLLFSIARDKRLSELIKTSILMLLGLTCLAIACTITSVLSASWSSQDSKVVGEVASFSVFLLIGGLGAATSVAWRLEGLLVAQPTLPETHLTDLGGLKYGKQGLLISVGCGLVFAFVLYMVFAAGLVKGPLFPDIGSPLGKVKEGLRLADFFENTGPLNGAEYAKLLVWLFLSGFAEKFVPDILDRIRTSAQSGKETRL